MLSLGGASIRGYRRNPMVEAILPRTCTPTQTICVLLAAFQRALAALIHVFEISSPAKLTRTRCAGLAGGCALAR